MSRECDICGKRPLKSASVTFSHKQNVKRQAPNLQSVKVKRNGTVETIKVCTSCISAGKIDQIKAI